MVEVKNRSTPVVEKKEAKENKCSCGCDCGCRQQAIDMFVKCGTMLVSALIISAAIATVPNRYGCKKMMPQDGPRAERPMRGPAVQDFRQFIMDNPKVLIDSVDKYYKAQEAAKPATPQMAPAELVKQIVNDKTNYSLGNPKGKYVIIEFFDYQCGWCKKTNKEMAAAVASKEGKNIRWIPIDTPIFGEASETIARYVLAAGEQKKYAEMHDAVGAATGKLDEAALIELGKKLGLNTDKLKKDANGEKIKAKLVANREFTKALNINGVPMLIVDGRINGGALIGDKLAAVVKESQNKK